MDGQTWAFAEPFVNMKAEDLMRLLWTFVILLRAPQPLFLNFFKPGTYIVFQGKQIVQRSKFMVNIAQLSSLLLGKITKPLQIQITPETVTMSFSFQVSHGTWKKIYFAVFLYKRNGKPSQKSFLWVIASHKINHPWKWREGCGPWHLRLESHSFVGEKSVHFLCPLLAKLYILSDLQ